MFIAKKNYTMHSNYLDLSEYENQTFLDQLKTIGMAASYVLLGIKNNLL